MAAYLPLYRNDSKRHIHRLCVYAHEDLAVTRELSHSFQLFYVLSTSMIKLRYLFFLYYSPCSQNGCLLCRISHSIYRILAIYLSANIFVFVDFNVHHIKWL